jgi:hypothetical protein
MSMTLVRNDDGTTTISCGDEELVIAADGSVVVRRKRANLPPLIGAGLGHRALVRLAMGRDSAREQSRGGSFSALPWSAPPDFTARLRREMTTRHAPASGPTVVLLDIPSGTAVDLAVLLSCADQAAAEKSVSLDLMLGDDLLQR